MPNVTLFVTSAEMPKQAALMAFTAECTQLCTGVLKAALDKVHIIYASVQHGRGQRRRHRPAAHPQDDRLGDSQEGTDRREH